MAEQSPDRQARLVELARQIDESVASIEEDFDTEKASKLRERYQQVNQIVADALDPESPQRQSDLSEKELDELERVLDALRFIHHFKVTNLPATRPSEEHQQPQSDHDG
ncbi:MAG: hypothetical protein AAFN77_14350 [Planctomycetota bacterium]